MEEKNRPGLSPRRAAAPPRAAGVRRPALRLLRRLGAAGARLVERPEGAWRVVSAGETKPAETVAVAALRTAGLVEPADEGGLRLSSAGAAALRRALADGDFAAQHRETRVLPLVEGASVRPVLVNVAESPIAWLRSRSDKAGRPLIDEPAFAAGERLRADFTRGQMMPRVTANWGATVAQGRRSGDSGGMAEITDAALAARLRVERALAAVGPELAGVLLDVCCFLRGIEEVETAQDWPRRSGKLVLRLALAALARHYGLATTARGSARGPMRHWGAEDYRPRAD